MSENRPEIPEPLFTNTLQVALVVRDLDAAMHTFVYEYGVAPWTVREFGPNSIEGLVHNDIPSEYTMRIGSAMIGNVEWELIQPLDDHGPYVEFLAEKGEGLHHVGMAVRDYDEAFGRLRDKGHNVVVGGTYRGMRLAYMSTDRDLKAMTEIFDEPPTPRSGPGADESVYPPEAA